MMIYTTKSFQMLFIRVSGVFLGLYLLHAFWHVAYTHYPPYPLRQWSFNADLHSNTHTFTNEQCDIAFPDLYQSLENSVKLRNGRKIQQEEISIQEGRCMLRLMIYGREVGFGFFLTAGKGARQEAYRRMCRTAVRGGRWIPRGLLRNERQRARAYIRHARTNRPSPYHSRIFRSANSKHRILNIPR